MRLLRCTLRFIHQLRSESFMRSFSGAQKKHNTCLSNSTSAGVRQTAQEAGQPGSCCTRPEQACEDRYHSLVQIALLRALSSLMAFLCPIFAPKESRIDFFKTCPQKWTSPTKRYHIDSWRAGRGPPIHKNKLLCHDDITPSLSSCIFCASAQSHQQGQFNGTASSNGFPRHSKVAFPHSIM